MDTRIICGIDPGMQGGISLIEARKSAITPMSIEPIPYNDKREIDIGKTVDIVSKANIIVIEKVHTMPGQGIASTGRFMRDFGILVGIAGTLKANDIIIDYQLISPQKWKNIILGNGKHTKEQSVEKALEYVNVKYLMRNSRCRKPDNNFAESLLIGLAYLLLFS